MNHTEVLDRSTAPAIAPFHDFILPPIQTHRLSNGLSLYALPSEVTEVFNLQLYFPGGRWYESKKGQAMFTSRLMLEGTELRGSYEINSQLESLGSTINFQAGYDFLTVEVYGLSEHFEEVLNILTEVLSVPAFPEEELARQKKSLIQQIKVNQKKVNILSSQLFRKCLYGESAPYGYSLSEEDISSISRQDLTNHFHAFKEKGVQYAFLVGSYSEHNFSSFVEKLSEWPCHQEDYERLYPEASKLSLSEDLEGAMQSSIRIGVPLPAVNSVQLPALELFNHLLGGYFGSRLMQNLREEKGLTYGISSQIVNHPRCSHLVIGTEVKKEDLALAFSEIRKEIDNWLAADFDAAELEQAKNHICGSYLKSIYSPFSLVEYHKSILMKGLPTDYYDRYISSIQQIGNQQLREISQQFFLPKKDHWLNVSVG